MRAVFLCLILGVSCRGDVGFVSPYATNSPCGPNQSNGPLKKLIPQEWRGADFRPACRAHDICYATPGSPRRKCDRQFLKTLQRSCKNSKRPRMCRLTSRMMYGAVARFGGHAYTTAQKMFDR